LDGSNPCCGQCGQRLTDGELNEDAVYCGNCCRPWADEGPYCKTCGTANEAREDQTRKPTSPLTTAAKEEQTPVMSKQPQLQEGEQEEDTRVVVQGASSEAVTDSDGDPEEAGTARLGMERMVTHEQHWVDTTTQLNCDSLSWIALTWMPRDLAGTPEGTTAQARVLCNWPKVLVCTWPVKGRHVTQLLMRQDRLPEGNSLEGLLWEINDLTTNSRAGAYDHVIIWKVEGVRMINTAKDPLVAVVALTDGISIMTAEDNEAQRIPKDHLTITPATEHTSGEWLEIVTGAKGGTWIEVRQSLGMFGKACKEGAKCTRNICALSNHEDGEP
jgi:hypothetical protein